MDRFPICIPFTLACECPHPNDWSNPANYAVDPIPTQCGIEQSTYDHYRKVHDLPIQSVRYMNIHEGWNIYEDYYWFPHCPVMNPGMDLQLFDTEVNCGSFNAIKILQTSMGVGVDGVWGPATIAAIKAATTDMGLAITSFTLARQEYYRGLKNFPTYGHGWLTRAANIGHDSMSMLSNPRGIRTLRLFTPSVKAY